MATKNREGKVARTQLVGEPSPDRVAKNLGSFERLVRVSKKDRDRIRALEDVVKGASEVTVIQGEKRAQVKGDMLIALQTLVFALDRAESVTVLISDDVDTELSSQEAADLLNVSRPFVVKLARNGELTHRMVGNRHRFQLHDVLNYDDRARRDRNEALTSIAPEGGYTAEDF